MKIFSVNDGETLVFDGLRPTNLILNVSFEGVRLSLACSELVELSKSQIFFQQALSFFILVKFRF